MSEKVTLELPEELIRRARAAAARTQRNLEDMLVEWIHRAAERPEQSLTDEELLTQCEAEMAEDAQDELGVLLECRREGALPPEEQGRLEELMQLYRRGLVRKAEALKVAVARGLKPPIG